MATFPPLPRFPKSPPLPRSVTSHRLARTGTPKPLEVKPAATRTVQHGRAIGPVSQPREPEIDGTADDRLASVVLVAEQPPAVQHPAQVPGLNGTAATPPVLPPAAASAAAKEEPKTLPEGKAAAPAGKTNGKKPPIFLATTPNGVMLYSDDTQALNEFEDLLKTLTGATGGSGPKLTVHYLIHAKADVIAEMLTTIFSGSSLSSGGGGEGFFGGNPFGANAFGANAFGATASSTSSGSIGSVLSGRHQDLRHDSHQSRYAAERPDDPGQPDRFGAHRGSARGSG